MEKDWIAVYSSDKHYQADLVHGMLAENDIESVVMNRQDSELLPLGTVEVYVHKEAADKAKELLENAGMI